VEPIDEAVIREFIREEYPRITAAVALVAGSRPAAEDAVQEALLRAWSKLERGDEIESLGRWVTAVAFNLSRSGIRRIVAERRARRRLEASLPDEAGGPMESDRIDVDRALAQLPRRQRECAVLRYFLDMTTGETAATLGISEGTVKSSLARARATLAQALGADDLEGANDRES
jgi:RNA polymerase sigma-70 factor (ECF subfamily)